MHPTSENKILMASYIDRRRMPWDSHGAPTVLLLIAVWGYEYYLFVFVFQYNLYSVVRISNSGKYFSTL